MCRRPILVVRATLDPEEGERFRCWYRELHLPHMLRIPGLERAYYVRRAGDDHGHMAVYTFASEERVRAALASAEAQQAREDWLPWMRHVRDLSVEVYANLTPQPPFRHLN